MDDTTAAQHDTGASARGRIVFVAFVLLGLAALFAMGWALRGLLLLTFLAILFAVLLRWAADGISRWTRLPATASVLAVMLILVGLVTLAMLLVVPTLYQQGSDLVRRFPDIADAAQRRISDTPFLSDAWREVQAQFSLPSPSAAMSQMGSILSFVSNSASNLVFLLFTTIFLALSPQTYVAGLRWLVPPAQRGFTLRLLNELGGTLRAWFGGQLVMMTGVGVLAWLGLWSIGVPYSLALGVFAGLLDFVPFIGPIIGAAPAVIVAFSDSPTTALWTVLLFVVIQQLEGNVFGPIVQQNSVSIPPALLLVFLFGAGQLLGLTGLLVATPLLAVLIVLVRRIYVERILEGVDRAGQVTP